MIRYCKQRDSYSCGPVAIVNAMKFFEQKSTYNDVPKLQRMMKCASPKGTKRRHFHKVVDKYFKYKKLLQPTMKEIDSYLLKGYPVILNHLIRENGETWGHYILVPQRGKDGFMVINEYKNETFRYVTRKIFNNYLRIKKRKRTGKRKYPMAWVLKGVK